MLQYSYKICIGYIKRKKERKIFFLDRSEQLQRSESAFSLSAAPEITLFILIGASAFFFFFLSFPAAGLTAVFHCCQLISLTAEDLQGAAWTQFTIRVFARQPSRYINIHCLLVFVVPVSRPIFVNICLFSSLNSTNILCFFSFFNDQVVLPAGCRSVYSNKGQTRHKVDDWFLIFWLNIPLNVFFSSGFTFEFAP